MKKILIIYASVGLGHKIVAENIGEALKNRPNLQVQFLDITKFYEGPLVEKSTKIYQAIIQQLPGLWRFLYTNKIFQKLTLPLRVPFASLQAGKLRKYLVDIDPDVILTTHPTATALVSYLKQKKLFTGPLVTTFSDFHFQPFWVFPNVDRYLVMTAEQKAEVMRSGYAAQRIIITGLPVHPAFEQKYEVAAVAKQFGLSHTKPIVLVMGGSRGWGIRVSDIITLLSSALDFEVVVVTGYAKKLFATLTSIRNKNLKVFGQLPSEQIARLFSAAKVLVTKPGGLSLAQALAQSLPMVLIHPLPTMEEMNQGFVLTRGAAVKAGTDRQLLSWVETLLTDKKFYEEQKQALHNLHVPHAARKAAQAIIDIL